MEWKPQSQQTIPNTNSLKKETSLNKNFINEFLLLLSTSWGQQMTKLPFRDAVEKLDYQELIKIKTDIDTGSKHIRRLIDRKLDEKKNVHETTCTYCNGTVEPNSIENYTLLFGPEDFKKKATFCGLDCLKAFIRDLEVMRLKRLKRVSEEFTQEQTDEF